MKSINNLPAEERSHFMLCPDCQFYFDKRDLGQVFDHVHNPDALKNIGDEFGIETDEPEWSSSHRVGNSEEFLNDENKTKVNLN